MPPAAGVGIFNSRNVPLLQQELYTEVAGQRAKQGRQRGVGEMNLQTAQFTSLCNKYSNTNVSFFFIKYSYSLTV